MRIDRVWAMPNRWTFTIPPIRTLLLDYDFKNTTWVDPFAGYNSPASITNDLDPESPALHHRDALEFLSELPSESADGILYDPPYSLYQARTKYGRSFGGLKYWADCKNECARLLKPGGVAVCFGWSSNGLGKSRGFEMQRVLLVAHGGSKNDTIITVEQKVGCGVG
jgi:hypothetical protein